MGASDLEFDRPQSRPKHQELQLQLAARMSICRHPPQFDLHTAICTSAIANQHRSHGSSPSPDSALTYRVSLIPEVLTVTARQSLPLHKRPPMPAGGGLFERRLG